MASHRGSKTGKLPNILCNFEASYQQLHCHYFSDQPLYNESLLSHQLKICCSVFLKISDAVQQHNIYFLQKADVVGKLGMHPLLKIMVALRMLFYGAAGDFNNKYLQISKTSSLKSTDPFCKSIVACFESKYLLQPNSINLGRLPVIGEKMSFLGMLVSVDCMHWQCKNFPLYWDEQFQGKEKVSHCFHYSFPFGHQDDSISGRYSHT